jgi:outer membrane protein assembly factor BamB
MGGLTTSTITDDNIIQRFAIGPPYRIAGSPIFWQGPSRSYVYVWGEGTPLVALPFLGEKYAPGSTVLDVDHALSSKTDVIPSDPGAMLSLSADGSAHGSGVVWASRPLTGNANQQTQPGIVAAFDAETLEELWNNQTNAARDDCGKFAKFSYPTVANGKVYIASFSNQICVYGLD